MDVHAQSTELYLPVGAGYNVQLLDFKHENGHICAKIEVTSEVWETIDLVMLFNLDWSIRNPGSVSGEQPVEIVMMLSKDVYRELKESQSLLTDSATFLQARADHPMKSTVNWYAIKVTEEVELPPHLEGLGTLREGFTTAWEKDYE